MEDVVDKKFGCHAVQVHPLHASMLPIHDEIFYIEKPLHATTVRADCKHIRA
jgi:hypothetical protein